MPIHAEELRRYLADATGRPVQLRINDNTHTMIHATRDGAGPGIRVSLNRMFLDAEREVIEVLPIFITKPTPRARHVIRAFINGAAASLAVARPPRHARGTGRGRHYHLDERAQAINRTLFQGRLAYRIIWGKGVRAGNRQCHVTLGTWSVRQSVVRIHPMLDNPAVPAYFLDYIIYHEMAHIVVPATTGCTGRNQFHTDEFYRIERAYPQYEMAKAWERHWLPRLIRAWNGGAEMPARSNDCFPGGA